MLIRNIFNKKAINSFLGNFAKKSQTTESFATPKLTFDSKLKRTHYCGSLGIENDGQKVQICGWLQTVRSKNFLLLRDIEGIVQVYLDDDLINKNNLSTSKLNDESVIAIRGIVRKRPAGQENLKLKSGTIEVKCEHLEIINEAKATLPFTISDLHRPNETTRLTHRYLDLRFSEMQQNLIFRSKFVHSIRQFMNENRFLDIETPTLFRRTPGGAREFLVPTNKPEHFYCLTQSPQQFKQLLMIGGLDRYYQVARCYRDEQFKAERQPEFTQVDIEMSFCDENDIINLIESLLDKCWPFPNQKLSLPFRKMTFEDAMNFYGVDKPDLRFDMKFSNLTNQFKSTGISKIDSVIANNEVIFSYGFKLPKEYDQFSLIDFNKIEKLFKSIFKDTNFPNENMRNSISFIDIDGNKDGNHMSKHMSSHFKDYLIDKFKLEGSKERCLVLFGNNKLKVQEILGKMRLRLADMLDEVNEAHGSKNNVNVKLLRDPKVFNFLWVVDFPLFTLNENTNQLESTHHPFTAPINEHASLVLDMKDLDKVIGLHYDIILNGSEIGGGSIRIHNSSFQRHVLTNILKEDTEKLEHLLKALEHGAPPHGGIALGLDRLCAILCGTKNMRDVIAFPKTLSGRDLMSSAPSKVDQSELDYYNISCIKKELNP